MGFIEIDGIAKTVVSVATRATDLRERVFEKNREAFEGLFSKYGVNYESFVLGDRVISCRMGEAEAKVEYDPENEEWFVVKAGGKTVPDDKREDCKDFIKEILFLEDEMYDEIRDGMKSINLHYIQNPDVVNPRFIVCGEYRDDVVAVYVEVPLEVRADVMVTGRIK